MQTIGLQFPALFFGLFCFLSIFFSVLVIALKNPVSSAFSLVMVLFSVAALFALQDAHFAAAIQILVYAGAIMVLFVFVIMLLNIDSVKLDFPSSRVRYAVATVVSLSFLAIIALALANGATSFEKGVYTVQRIEEMGGNILLISQKMFSDYLFTFELVSILLLLAVVGAVVLAKRKVD